MTVLEAIKARHAVRSYTDQQLPTDAVSHLNAEIDFPAQAGMTRDDFVIICGDFGGVRDGSNSEKEDLGWLERWLYTTLFVDGKHENYDKLVQFPVEDWCSGSVQRIRPHVLHLMRGQVFHTTRHDCI